MTVKAIFIDVRFAGSGEAGFQNELTRRDTLQKQRTLRSRGQRERNEGNRLESTRRFAKLHAQNYRSVDSRFSRHKTISFDCIYFVLR